MKRVLSIFMVILLVVFSSMNVIAVEDNTEFSIKIVHTNDIHARVKESDYDGIIGMPKLKTVIDNHINGSDMSFVLDSGDIFHGQSIATLVQGESIAKLIGACGYDAMTAGNHDWNYGKDRLKDLVNITKENNSNDFYMLTGNVINNDGTKFFDDEYLIKEIEKDGETLKVGTFGVIDPKIYNRTSPSNVSGLAFTNMKEYSENAVDYLKSQGCQLIIALTHSYSPVELASSVDDVDLWLAGHEHVSLNEYVETPDGDQTLVIENSYYLYGAGLIELNFDLNSSNEVENLEYVISSVDYANCADVEPNSYVQNVLTEITDEQRDILDEVIGQSPADLDGIWEHVRIDETNLGRVVTDSYLLETGADIAFENAGGIKASISQGDVTYGDVIDVMPYGNYIVTKQLSGAEIIDVLEISIDIQINNIAANDSGIYDAWPSNSGSHLQVGGMTVEYDMTKEKGQRVVSVKVCGSVLDKDTFYTVATNNYVAGSSAYPQLASKELKGEYAACDEALIEYFRQDDNFILNSINTQRMNKVSESIVPESTSSTDATSGTDNTVPTSLATNSTDNTSAIGSAISTPDSNGSVKTGGAVTVFGLIAIVCVSSAVVYVAYRKKNLM